MGQYFLNFLNFKVSSEDVKHWYSVFLHHYNLILQKPKVIRAPVICSYSHSSLVELDCDHIAHQRCISANSNSFLHIPVHVLSI
jgi:hypothetical protein